MIVSELKCCKRCGAYLTCDHKGECCVECEYFDPVDIVCMAGPERKPTSPQKPKMEENDGEIDPATFLFEDDDEDEDLSDLPPERDSDEDDDDDDDFDEDDDDFDLEDDDDDEW